MKIENIETYHIQIPLHTPFKTALRTVTVANTIIVKITSDNGITGWGEAPPTHVITGESLASINNAITEILKPALLGESLDHYEQIFKKLHTSLVGNTSAKAALDMAVYDCVAQKAGMPLAHFLGGYNEAIETDYTVSVNHPEQMATDAFTYKNNGFDVLKIKVGKDDINKDIARIQSIRKRVGNEVLIRLDANQGWERKEAVKAIRKMEDLGLNIELIEQPVKRYDLASLKYVTDNTDTPIMADESVFSSLDARQVLEKGAADFVNIKLMKAGGIHEAMKIAKLAAVYEVECMVGSMIETKLGITAAAHFAASQPNITRYDFDAPLMLTGDSIEGGISYQKNQISLGNSTGLGVKKLNKNFIRKSDLIKLS